MGCLAAAEHETNRILSPVRGLGNIIQDIMAGKEIGRLPDEYEELMPLINKVEEQHDEIENYLEDIEEERNTTRTILDTISDGIILLNSRKEIVDYNERVKEIFHVEKTSASAAFPFSIMMKIFFALSDVPIVLNVPASIR